MHAIHHLTGTFLVRGTPSDCVPREYPDQAMRRGSQVSGVGVLMAVKLIYIFALIRIHGRAWP